jgi:hypothetical protein
MKSETENTTADTLLLTRPAQAEVTAEQLDNVIGGLQFIFKLVAVKTISWAHD